MTKPVAVKPQGMTQRTEVLRLLEAAGNRGVCVSDVPVAVGYCLRNRVGDLAKEGHRITSVRCTVHPHRGNVVRYFLVRPQITAYQRDPQRVVEAELFVEYGRRGHGV